MNEPTTDPTTADKPPLKHIPRAEYGLLFTPSLHCACFISTVTGQKPHVLRGPGVTPQGKPQIRWAYKSTHLADEAMALWNSIGLEAFGTPKDWDAMDLEERKAVTNVVTAFAANQRLFLRHCHE